MRFFRIQESGIPFEAMASWSSEHGDERPGGVAASDRPDGGPGFGGAWDAYDDDTGEVIVFEGYISQQIYDGWLVVPRREVVRFTKGQWRRMLDDGSAWDWEACDD